MPRSFKHRPKLATNLGENRCYTNSNATDRNHSTSATKWTIVFSIYVREKIESYYYTTLASIIIYVIGLFFHQIHPIWEHWITSYIYYLSWLKKKQFLKVNPRMLNWIFRISRANKFPLNPKKINTTYASVQWHLKMWHNWFSISRPAF